MVQHATARPRSADSCCNGWRHIDCRSYACSCVATIAVMAAGVAIVAVMVAGVATLAVMMAGVTTVAAIVAGMVTVAVMVAGVATVVVMVAGIATGVVMVAGMTTVAEVLPVHRLFILLFRLSNQLLVCAHQA